MLFSLITVPERLKYLRIITLKDYSHDLLSVLQELGLIHIEELKKIPEEDLRKLSDRLELLSDFNKLLHAIESNYLSSPKLIKIDLEVNMSELDSYILKLYNDLKSLIEKLNTLSSNISRINEELNNYEMLIKYLSRIPTPYSDLPIANLSFDGDLFFSRLIRIKHEVLQAFIERVKEVKDVEILFTVNLEGDESLVSVLGFKSALTSFNSILDDLKGEVILLPQIDLNVCNYVKELRSRIEDLKYKLYELQASIVKITENNLEFIARAKVIYETYRDRIERLLNALMTDYSFIVEGWIPATSYDTLRNALYSKFKYILVEEVERNDNTLEPPSKLNNHSIYKYFELITRLYGIPKYNEWDPTRLITYSFLIFFGLMLADVIYGIALIIITRYLLDKLGFTDNPYSEGYVNLKSILMILGTSSALFGFLSNTYAGYSIPYLPTIIHVSDPLSFIKLSLMIGLLHVNLAHILGVIRAIKSSDKSLLLSELGLLIAEFSAIPYILWYFLNIRLLPVNQVVYTSLLYTSFIGLALLIVGKFMSMKALGLFLWIFDVTGLLGDIFSYTRIAGIGLATYLMAKSFNDLALMAYQSLYLTIPLPLINVLIALILSMVVVFFANTMNLAFGVIGPFVHSLRLCFVEFLPKFYEGGGREFKPFKLHIAKYVIIGRTK